MFLAGGKGVFVCIQCLPNACFCSVEAGAATK